MEWQTLLKFCFGGIAGITALAGFYFWSTSFKRKNNQWFHSVFGKRNLMATLFLSIAGLSILLTTELPMSWTAWFELLAAFNVGLMSAAVFPLKFKVSPT
jgi:glucose uptake protein GlcU